jgi:hypothetical protein
MSKILKFIALAKENVKKEWEKSKLELAEEQKATKLLEITREVENEKDK